MSDKIWNSLQSLGDDLIADAEESKVRQHFIKKRLLLKRIAAACVLLVFAITLPLPMLPKQIPDTENHLTSDTDLNIVSKSITIDDSLSPESSDQWQNALKYELDFEGRSLNTTKTDTITIDFGLQYFHPGVLVVKVISDGNLVATFEKEVAASINDAIKIPLDRLSDKNGKLSVSFTFEQEKTDGLPETDASLTLASFEVAFETDGEMITFGKPTIK